MVHYVIALTLVVVYYLVLSVSLLALCHSHQASLEVHCAGKLQQIGLYAGSIICIRMYVCMYVCMYMWTTWGRWAYVHVCIRAYVHTCIYMHTCICAYMYCMHANVHVYRRAALTSAVPGPSTFLFSFFFFLFLFSFSCSLGGTARS